MKGQQQQPGQFAGYGMDPYAQYYQQQQAGFPYAMGQQMGQVAGAQSGIPSFPQQPMQQQPQIPGMLPLEQSYIENILRLNRGKLATVYMTFENNREWNAKIFKGIIEAAGRDHIILSDPQTGKRYLLLMVYLDYITFDEELEYDYPFGAGAQLATFSPR